MSKFKPLSAYNNLTPPPPSPTIGVDVATTQTGSPSPSSIPATGSAAEVRDVTFLIDSVDGEFPLQCTGTEEFLQTVFKRYSTEGVTLFNQHGFTWYSPYFIKKITVKF